MPTILPPGASRGLGLEFPRQYAEAGWRVIATCRNPARAEKLRGVAGTVEIHALDAADFPAVAALAETLGDVAIDVLLANAGIVGPPGPTAAANGASALRAGIPVSHQ